MYKWEKKSTIFTKHVSCGVSHVPGAVVCNYTVVFVLLKKMIAFSTYAASGSHLQCDPLRSFFLSIPKQSIKKNLFNNLFGINFSDYEQKYI